MKIDFTNMPNGSSKLSFIFRYYFNIIRTWYLFSFIYPWVEYRGFVRVMKKTSFGRMNISIGHNVQFGDFCNIASDVKIGNYVLIAGRVCFIGKNDHDFKVPSQYIWNGKRNDNEPTIVEDDVWIGHGSIIICGVRIGKGSVIASGSLVNKDIPPCEIWGGVPAKKIRDRFNSLEEKMKHLEFLEQ